MYIRNHIRKTGTLLGACLAVLLCLFLAVPAKAAAVALTFDDGPTRKLTSSLVEILQEEDVPATFFLCGYRLEQYGDIASLLGDENFELGVHGYSHQMMNSLSAEALQEELDNTAKLITEFTGRMPTLMRPPGGLYNDTVQNICAQSDYPIILWSVDPEDWRPGNTAVSVCSQVVKQVQDGDIILLHDLNRRTAEALPDIIRTLKQQGVEFLTVSELAERQGITLEPGVCYDRLSSNSG